MIILNLIEVRGSFPLDETLASTVPSTLRPHYVAISYPLQQTIISGR